MHLSNKTFFNKQRPFVRIDGYGQMIPGSVVFRDRVPKQGTWRQLGSIDQCCNPTGNSYILVQNNTSNGTNPGATVASLSTADGTINYIAGIAQNGGMMIFVIPGGIDETFTLTLGATGSDGVDIDTSTISGGGTISVASPTYLEGATLSTTFTTSATPDSQYAVSLTDD